MMVQIPETIIQTGMWVMKYRRNKCEIIWWKSTYESMIGQWPHYKIASLNRSSIWQVIWTLSTKQQTLLNLLKTIGRKRNSSDKNCYKNISLIIQMLQKKRKMGLCLGSSTKPWLNKIRTTWRLKPWKLILKQHYQPPRKIKLESNHHILAFGSHTRKELEMRLKRHGLGVAAWTKTKIAEGALTK